MCFRGGCGCCSFYPFAKEAETQRNREACKWQSRNFIPQPLTQILQLNTDSWPWAGRQTIFLPQKLRGLIFLTEDPPHIRGHHAWRIAIGSDLNPEDISGKCLLLSEFRFPCRTLWLHPGPLLQRALHRCHEMPSNIFQPSGCSVGAVKQRSTFVSLAVNLRAHHRA